MSPITARGDLSKDFQSELPLHPAATELLLNFFDIGWPDPSKLHQQSAHLRNLLGTARDVIASHLGVQNSELEFVGELGVGFQTAMGGLMQESNRLFVHSQIDRQIVHAFGREHAARGGRVQVLKPDGDGFIDYSHISSSLPAVISWQATNRETGVMQQRPTLSNDALLFADMTASYPLNRLPENWDCALWDPRSFSGPQGLAIIAISNKGKWRNPGPELDNRRVFGSYSKPLLLATAVALENWAKTADENLQRLSELNHFTRVLLHRTFPNVRIAGTQMNSDPRFIAFALPDVIAEEILRKVEALGFLIDAGSACGSGALSPSHVLTAMGFGADGNLRITLKPEHSQQSIEALVEGISAST